MSDFENIPSIDLELDPSVRNAYTAARDTSTMTPVIKEELKWTILKKRHSSGLGDIDLDEEKPTIKHELTPKEVERKERRKAQNRKAAERCRKKKQRQNEQLLVEFENEKKRRKELEQEVLELKKEKEILGQQLKEHMCICPLNTTPSPSTTPSFQQQQTFDFPGYPHCFGSGSLHPQQQQQHPVYNSNNVQHMGDNMPTQREAINISPFQQDPFDDENVINTAEYPFYPQTTQIKAENQTTCAVASSDIDPVLPEIDVPDNFDVFQPISPDMVPGRQSISDYYDIGDHDFLSH